jgi:aspartate/methionine/tyrosine aminotransferase
MLPIAPFRLERYFGIHEFSAKHLLSSSDCESITVQELLQTADAETKSVWGNLKLGYTESQGLPQLRKEISSLYEGSAAAVTIAAENVVIGAPEELIFIAMSALLTSADHVICLGPAYQSLHEVARAIGCTVDMWNLQINAAGSWGLDWDALSALLRPETRMIIFNAPHNPTGFLPTAAEQLRLVDFARTSNGGLLLFSDEMYRLLEFRDPEAQRLPSTCTLYRSAITLSGMSKAFGLPGLRIGWLASGLGDDFVHKVLSLKDYTTICSSGPSEVLSWIGLRSWRLLTDRNNQIVRDNVAMLESCVARHPSVMKLIAPLAGSTTLVRWLEGAASLETFCGEALKARGLMIVPGSMFDSAFATYFRVGLGRRDFSVVLAVLDDLLRERA